MDTGESSGWFAFSCSARLSNNGRWLELMRHQFPVMLAVIGSADQNADLYERGARYRSGSITGSSRCVYVLTCLMTRELLGVARVNLRCIRSSRSSGSILCSKILRLMPLRGNRRNRLDD